MGAGLLAKAVGQSPNVLTDTPHSRASPLPHWFVSCQGYRGEYRDKIPLNRFGVAPVIIPSVGTHYGPVAAELVLLGFNAAMVTTGVRF